MKLTLKEITEKVIENANNRIQSVDFYYKAKEGEQVDAPVHPETVDKLLEYYGDLDKASATMMYLDACDTLETANKQDLESFNTPHIITYNKTIALAIIINKYNEK